MGAATVRFADDMTPQRLQLVTFPVGVRIIPNPFNRVPGFMTNEHYFVPGFPQMAQWCKTLNCPYCITTEADTRRM